MTNTVAVVDASPDPYLTTQRTSFRDEEGRKDTVEYSRRGKRTLSVRHFVDGSRVAEIKSHWNPTNGGWIVQQREILIYEGSAIRTRISVSIENTRLAHASSAKEYPIALASLLMRTLQPTSLYAAAFDEEDEERCGREKISAGLAAVGMVGSCATIETGVGVIFCAGAVASYIDAMDNLDKCLNGRE
jgi:hypothetical protein